MIRFYARNTEWRFTFWFFAELALFAVTEKGVLLLYLLLPVVVHELGHLLLMAVLGVRVKAVAFTAAGINIVRGSGQTIGCGRELAVCLAGAAANLGCALLLRLLCFQSMRVMLLVAANTAVAVFNLLPIGDLDGGLVLHVLAGRFFSPQAARVVSRTASMLVLGALFGFLVFLAINQWLNLSLLVVFGYLVMVVLTRE